jgi:hypothetical protein
MHSKQRFSRELGNAIGETLHPAHNTIAGTTWHYANSNPFSGPVAELNRSVSTPARCSIDV